MKNHKMALLALVFALSPFVVLPFQASAEDALDAGTSDAAAVAETDAGADDAANDADVSDAAPPLPAFDETPFPEEKSPRPKDAEWKTAPEVALSERKASMYSCKPRRIREWIQIRCDTTTAEIRMLGGNAPEEVSMRLAPVTDEWQRVPESGEIVFPVRRGDRRVFEWTTVEFGYKGMMTAQSMAVITEEWLSEEEKPLLYMQ